MLKLRYLALVLGLAIGTINHSEASSVTDLGAMIYPSYANEGNLYPYGVLRPGGTIAYMGYVFTNEGSLPVGISLDGAIVYLSDASVVTDEGGTFTLASDFGAPIITLHTSRLETGGGTPGVPEPGTWAMMLLGFVSVGYAGLRRRGSKAGRESAGALHLTL